MIYPSASLSPPASSVWQGAVMWLMLSLARLRPFNIVHFPNTIYPGKYGSITNIYYIYYLFRQKKGMISYAPVCCF